MARTLPINYTNVQVTGTLTTVGNTVVIPGGVYGTIGINLLSTSAVAPTVVFEATIDGTTWIGVNAFPVGTISAISVPSATAAGQFEINSGGYQSFRLRLTAITSGSMPVVLNGTITTKQMRVSNKQAGDLQVTTTPTTSTLVDRSGTIAAASTAQALMPANAARKGWRLQNNSANVITFNDVGGTAGAVGTAGSFVLTAGSYYESAASGQTLTAISVWSATINSSFAATEW